MRNERQSAVNTIKDLFSLPSWELTYCYAADFRRSFFSPFRWLWFYVNSVMGNKPPAKLPASEMFHLRQATTFSEAEIRMLK